MKEEALQYIWKYKLLKTINFTTTKGEAIEILDYGELNKNQGPDFFMGRIKINNTIFIGNIEIHVKSSDWILHQHNGNKDYENIILHVVYNNDVDIEILEEKNIPTLEIKNYIDQETITKYNTLVENNDFIPCEKLINPKHIPLFFSEETVLKKLQEKTIFYDFRLKESQNNYEQLLFINLAYTFGLKVNADVFLQIAQTINYNTISKIRQNENQLEALFYGLCGWLNNINNDEKTENWKKEYNFLKVKYKLNEISATPKFSKLRPPNFPNIRLSQLANLLHKEPHLLSKIKDAKNISQLREILKNIKASNYWDNHYIFGKTTSKSFEKKLSEDFINLILINCFLPLKYYFERTNNPEIEDQIMDYYLGLKPEKNSIITHWENLGVKIRTALDSQAFLHQYKHNCLTKNCLNCSIGFQVLKDDK